MTDVTLPFLTPNHARTLTLASLFALPSEFTADWNPDFNVYELPDGSFTTNFDITTLMPTGTAMYVATDGDDSTGDGSIGNPYRSGAKAYTEGADIVYFRAGDYTQEYLFGASFQPARDFAVIAYDGVGTVNLIYAPANSNLTWTQEVAPNDSVWSTTIVNLNMVVDKTGGYTNVSGAGGTVPVGSSPDDYLKDGTTEVPIPLTVTASIAACQALPNSYYLSGTTLYVHTWDGREPDDNLFATSQNSFVWFNSGTDRTLYYDGLEIWGRGQCRTEHTVTNTNVMAAVDSAFRYSDWVISPVRIQGTRYNYFVRCECSDTKNVYNTGGIDGFNYAAGAGGINTTVRFLEQDCKARRLNGTANNENGSTAHDETCGIRLNGDYGYSIGPVIADVLGSYTVCLGVTSGNSQVSSNISAKCAFQSGTASSFTGNRESKMWVKNWTAVGEYYALSRSTGGNIYDYGGGTDYTTGGNFGTITSI